MGGVLVKRLALLIAMLAAVLFVAAACGGDDEGEGEDAGGGADTTEVSGTVELSGWASSPEETKLLKQVIADFEQQYPNIKVKYTPISGDYPTAMLAKFSARRPPDVFYVDSNVAPDWIKQGVLEPLDSYIGDSGFDTGPFFPSLLEAFKGPDEMQYGLPKDWSPLGTFTNDELLEKAGVDPPETWDDLRSAAEELEGQVKGGKPICLSADWARLLAFVYQNGGSFLNDEKTEATINSPEAKEAVDFYVGLVNDGLAAPPDQLGAGWCGEALGKGVAAIVFEGNWLVPFMDATFPDVAYSINPMVKGDEDGNLAFTVSYSMGRDSKNKEAAWVLLSYLTGPDGMGTWTSLGLALPSRDDVAPPEGREPLIDAADASRPWQFAPGFTNVITTAGNELTAVFEKKKSVDEMLQKLEEEANNELQ
jgi:multiple sugar transport system substrate-binding protein